MGDESRRIFGWCFLFHLAAVGLAGLWFFVNPWLWENVWYYGPTVLGFALFFWRALPLSYVMVPAAHKGILLLLGQRQPVVLKEGLQLIIPWLMNVEPVPYEQKLNRLEGIEVLSKVDPREDISSIRVTIKGSFEWKLDPRPEQLRKYRELTEEAIVTGLTDEVKRSLEEIAGTLAADDFISLREAIGLHINCLLRLSWERIPYHRKPPDKILPYCRKNRQSIRTLLEGEAGRAERSEVEDRYGIDVIAIRISDVDYNEEVKRAFEEKRRSQETMKARQVEKEAVLQITEGLEKSSRGLSASEAINDALVILGKATKNVISVEGGGALPIITVQPPSGKGGTS